MNVDLKIPRRLASWNDQAQRRSIEQIKSIVLHCTETPTLDEALALSEDGRHVGAHIYIDRDGQALQVLELDRVGAHVAGHNLESVGIELVNRGRWPEHFTVGSQIPTEPYPPPQLAALTELLGRLKRQLPRVDSLSRHSDLDQRTRPASDDPSVQVRRRIDPGPLFPWDEFRHLWAVPAADP